MDKFFLVYKDRVLIHYEVLFYFGISIDFLREIPKLSSGDNWESLYLNRGGTKQRFIVLDSIPENVRSEFKIPTAKQIIDCKENYEVIESEINLKKTSEIKLFIENAFNRYMYNEDQISGSHFLRYIEMGYSPEEAKTLTRTRGILEICTSLKQQYRIELIYKALVILIEENEGTNKFSIIYKIPSIRTFYEHMTKCSQNDIDSIIIHGLTGKPGNRRSISKSTELLVVELLKHFNQLSENVIKEYANTIITALPEKFNNGNHISRSKVHQIKTGKYKNIIRAAIHGNSWIRETMIPDVHRIETAYPLDCVEIDFTKVHACVVDHQDEDDEVTIFICRIIDRCSKAIIGLASGYSECFQLFQIAFRRMLELTKYKLPAEMVYDLSPAFESKEFERIRLFIKELHIKFYPTRNPQAKAQIESHFKLLFETYLPQHVGSLGGNVRSTKKHRPKHEILVLLQRKEFMNDIYEWENILNAINKKYNSTSNKSDCLAPLDKFHHLAKPHTRTLDEQYAAYISWHHTQRKFLQSEFLVEYDSKEYHFGWPPNDINSSPEKEKFISNRTGDRFDIFMHPERPRLNPLYVFELNTMKLVGEFPFVEMFYGNSIDQKIEPSRRTKLIEFLKQRKIMENGFKNQIKEISREVKKNLGIDLNELIKEIQKNGEISHKRPDLIRQIMDLLNNREVSEIDPFRSTVFQPTKTKSKPRQTFRPTKVKHKNK